MSIKKRKNIKDVLFNIFHREKRLEITPFEKDLSSSHDTKELEERWEKTEDKLKEAARKGDLSEMRRLMDRNGGDDHHTWEYAYLYSLTPEGKRSRSTYLSSARKAAGKGGSQKRQN